MALSLLLCVASVVIWVRSEFVGDFVWHNEARSATGVFFGQGSVMVTRRRSQTFNPVTPGVGPPEWEVLHERPPRDLFGLMDTIYGPGNYSRHAGFAWGTTGDRTYLNSRDAVRSE